MPSVLSDDDKETVRRMVPKASNKIQAVAVARLYIAYPDRSKWTYTGLQGAVVLSNDLIGNTYWLKLVDISPANRGVMWDQEIYEKWSYNQDRTFFHTFETEDCLAGLSFADEKEARHFLKKMMDREKNANKATKANSFGGGHTGGSHRHSRLGGLFGGHRHSSAPTMQPTPPESPTTYISPRQNERLSAGSALNGSNHTSEFPALDAIDPNWRETWGDDLKAMGITDDIIRDQQDFIADYIREKQAEAVVPVMAELNGVETQRAKAPPPPPPPPAPSRKDSESSHGPGMLSTPARRGAPPAPPPSRRTNVDTVQREPTSPREPSPPKGPPPPKFAAPPPLPDAGKFANTKDPPRNRQHAPSISNPGPPAPPRPPKTPNDYEPGETGSRFGVPPPFMGQRVQGPPPTPPRGSGPPPPPARGTLAREASSSYAHAVPPLIEVPPPLPPKTPNTPSSAAPPLPPSTSRPVPPTPARDAGPPPPPVRANLPPPPPPLLPATNVRATSTTVPPSAPPLPPSTGAPPPPPMPSASGPPPPPPPPPNRDSGYASGVPALPQPTGGREDVLAGIKQAGGVKALKKVDRSQIRDRSAAMVPGGADTGPHGSGLPPPGVTPGGGGGGLADALAMALQKRKEKVSGSDDEAEDDDW